MAVTTPILFVHGDQDPVDPPSQSRLMHAALVELGRTTGYIELHGGHMVKDTSGPAKALDAELQFHRAALGIAAPTP